jgi:hypothetical protein
MEGSRYEKPTRCWYCGSPPFTTDINDDKHPNLLHRYQGHWECEYCKYDREVVEPRHRKLMQETELYYDREYYNAPMLDMTAAQREAFHQKYPKGKLPQWRKL